MTPLVLHRAKSLANEQRIHLIIDVKWFQTRSQTRDSFWPHGHVFERNV